MDYCVRVFVYMPVCMYILSVFLHVCVCVRTYVHVWMCVCVHVRIHIFLLYVCCKAKCVLQPKNLDDDFFFLIKSFWICCSSHQKAPFNPWAKSQFYMDQCFSWTITVCENMNRGKPILESLQQKHCILSHFLMTCQWDTHQEHNGIKKLW